MCTFYAVFLKTFFRIFSEETIYSTGEWPMPLLPYTIIVWQYAGNVS